MQKSRIHEDVRRLVISALCVAAAVILTRFLGFSPEFTPVRFEIGFLPILLVAHLFGPLYSGLAYLAADAVGCLAAAQTLNPFIMLCKLAVGVLMGAFFYRRKLSLLRSIVGFAVIAVTIEFVCMANVFQFYFGYPPREAYSLRALTAFANLPVRIFLSYMLGLFLQGARGRIFYGRQSAQAFITYAHSFQAVTRPGLERISHMLALLGHPEEKLSCIHIAGTNGKGSVSAFLDAILSAAGYRVGRYTSPNLVRVNERMKLCGKDISDEEMQALFAGLERIAEQTKKELHGDAPTQFEIWTAAAFLWFARKGCDYVVLETGMGGALDATNAITRNTASVLTRIDLDHTEYLGSSIEEITATKCGILKEKCDLKAVFTVEQEKAALEVIERAAADKKLDLVCVAPRVCGNHHSLFQKVEWKGEAVTLGLAGVHQCENAALAAAVAEKMGIDDACIREGLATARHPGRLEILRQEPLLLYDGAHNPNGVRALSRSLECASLQNLTVIFACMKDKEIDESLLLLKPYAARFLFTTVQGNPRAESPKGVAERAEKIGIVGEQCDTLEEAIAKADGENTLICGSLYLYADLPDFYKK